MLDCPSTPGGPRSCAAIPWPGSLCFRKKAVELSATNRISDTILVGHDETHDPLGDARGWLSSANEREERISKRHAERSAAGAKDNSAVDTRLGKINAPSPVTMRRPSTTGGNAVYPTPPDAIQNLNGVTPSMDGNLSSPGQPLSVVADIDIDREPPGEENSVHQNDDEMTEAADGKPFRSDNNLLSEAENMFEDMGGDVFGDNDITEADFSFFDEQPDEMGMDMSFDSIKGSRVPSALPIKAEEPVAPASINAPPSAESAVFAKPELKHARSSQPEDAPQRGRDHPAKSVKRASSPFDPDSVFKRLRAAASQRAQRGAYGVGLSRGIKVFGKVDFDSKMPMLNKKYEHGGLFDFVPNATDTDKLEPGTLPKTDYLRRHGKTRAKQQADSRRPSIVKSSNDSDTHLLDHQLLNLDGDISDGDDSSSDSDIASILSVKEPVSPVKSTVKQSILGDDDAASYATTGRDQDLAEEPDEQLALELPRLSLLDGPDTSLCRYFTDPEPLSLDIFLSDEDMIQVAQLVAEQAASGSLSIFNGHSENALVTATEEDARTEQLTGLDDGVLLYGVDRISTAPDATMMGHGSALLESMETLCGAMSDLEVVDTNVVVYFMYSTSNPGTIVEACMAFQRFFESYRRTLVAKRGSAKNEIVLQLVSADAISSSTSMVVTPSSELIKLCMETYDRCTLFGGNMPAPAIRLEQPLPRIIDFKLSPAPSSSLARENSCIHIAYARSIDGRWVTAAWTDDRGNEQATAAYCLGRKGEPETRTMNDVAHEIWQTTVELISTWKVHYRIIMTKCGPTDEGEIDFWVDLARTEMHASVTMIVMTVETNPSLQLVPAPIKMSLQPLSIYTTPVSTPQTNIVSPEASAAPATPARDTAGAVATPGGESNGDADVDSVLADVMDQTWGAIVNHRLNNTIGTTSIQPALISGYLIKRTGSKAEDVPSIMEVNLVYTEASARTYEPLLREMLSYFRGLGTLARARGVVDRVTDVRPWHVAAAEKALRALYILIPPSAQMASGKAYLAQRGSAPQEMPTAANPASESREPHAGGGMPSVDDPFNFPTDEALPVYSAHPTDAAVPPAFADGAGPSTAAPPPPPPGASPARPSLKPIAIPQVVPDASSPFVTAYPPCLLARGITEQSWISFLDTVSAFLTAKVGDRAVSHAGDMAKHFAQDSMNFGKSIASHSKTLGKDIARYAKRGNIFGVAATLVHGAVSLPVMTALGAVDTATRLPGAAVGAIAKKPKTPADRVNAYNVVVNKKWLHQRHLHIQLVDTPGLAHVLQLPTAQLLAVARSGKEGSASGMLQALDLHIEPLKVSAETSLGLSDKSLWLVLVEFDPEELQEPEEQSYGKDTGKN
ncbi:hypothetical protein MY11210_006274 [Beauveria gryllotalpidicola]